MSNTLEGTGHIPPHKSTIVGFTLVEILVALCIILIALVPLIRLHILSIRHTDASMLMARAALLANAKLAEIVAQDDPEIGEENGRFDDAHRGVVFYWASIVTETQSSELAAADVSDIRHVRLDVSWRENGGDAVVSLDTLVHILPDRQTEMLDDQKNNRRNRKATRPGLGR
jgi:type II secretion system protein I